MLPSQRERCPQRNPFSADCYRRSQGECTTEATYLGTDVGTAALYDLALLSGPAMAADIDSDGPPAYEQTLALVLAASRNMADAAREAGVRADWFDREVVELEGLIAAGNALRPAPESVRLLKVTEG